jgi:hypothetical protein
MGDTESHINGLINAVHLLSPLDDGFGQRSNLEEELANRYLLLCVFLSETYMLMH